MSRDNDRKDAAARAKTGRCPICGKPRHSDYRPFCSKRCADLDLGRWLAGSYAIPVTEDDDEDGETPASEDDKQRGDEPAG
jgi:endogenous inhibitor of DNA gyrase (YacG/DUF329 family)